MNNSIAFLSTMLFMHCTTLMSAEFFNPFELDPIQKFLGFTCEIRSKTDAIIIKHDCKDHIWVYQQINHARKEQKYLGIHLDKLKKIENVKNPFYEGESIRDSIIFISDIPLVFEYLYAKTKWIFPCQRIGGLFYEYRCYLVKHDAYHKEIWLTEEQNIFLNKLLTKQKVKNIKLNLSALKRAKLYGEYLYPSEIIVPERLEVN